MYHKLLNKVFSAVVKTERCYSGCYSNKFLSFKQGVQNVLLNRINKNEDARLAVFEGRIKEQLYSNDLIKSATARVEASYKSGQIDSGNYHTQLHKIKEIALLYKINEHNSHHKDRDLPEDCLRKLAQIGKDIDKSLYAQHLAEKVETEGAYRKIYTKHQELPRSDRMSY